MQHLGPRLISSFSTVTGALLLLTVVWGLVSPGATAQSTLPGLPGTLISGALPAGLEPSGAVFHTRQRRLYVVSDTGVLTSMAIDGSAVTSTIVGGDLEAVCVAHPMTGFIYLGVEVPNMIIEYDVANAAVSRVFNLTGLLPSPGAQGLEALTFVPDANHPEGGLFHAGNQADGLVYVLSLPLLSNPASTAAQLVSTYQPSPFFTDISGLHYDVTSHRIYALFDGPNRLRAVTATGAFIQEWFVPGGQQEALALDGCTLVIGEDNGPLTTYAPFPSSGSCPTFSADVVEISLQAGGVQHMTLEPGGAFGGQAHLVLGSAFGTFPGTPVGAFTLPLNVDSYLLFTLNQPNTPPLANGLALLDAQGTSTADFVIPALTSPVFAGVILHHAFVVVDGSLTVTHVSNAVPLTLIP